MRQAEVPLQIRSRIATLNFVRNIWGVHRYSIQEDIFCSRVRRHQAAQFYLHISGNIARPKKHFYIVDKT